MIIDSHAHVLPGAIPSFLEAPRHLARFWLKPLAASMHQAQTLMRHLPIRVREGLDELGGLAPLPGLLLESTVTDLIQRLDENHIDRVLVISAPPIASNDFVFEAHSRDPRILPVVNIPKGTLDVEEALKSARARGAVALKIHGAADGEGPESLRYQALVATADELGLPVIIHTGCMHSHVLYRSPEFGRAEAFEPWFKRHPNVRFVLAHMNLHEPLIAMDLMERYPNVYADTSWQPAETIGEAVRRVGAERVLLGTDWPFVGDNYRVSLARIDDAMAMGTLTSPQADAIRGLNAARLFSC
jgi:predicted TIM-barrel fold metal-dependent hydrolase